MHDDAAAAAADDDDDDDDDESCSIRHRTDVPPPPSIRCYSYGLMGLSKSIYQLPLLALPHLRPLGTSVGGKLLGTGASCIVTAVLA